MMILIVHIVAISTIRQIGLNSIQENNMSGDNHLKRIAHEYAALAGKWYDPSRFKGQTYIPHNPKNNRKTKSKGRK